MRGCSFEFVLLLEFRPLGSGHQLGEAFVQHLQEPGVLLAHGLPEVLIGRTKGPQDLDGFFLHRILGRCIIHRHADDRNVTALPVRVVRLGGLAPVPRVVDADDPVLAFVKVGEKHGVRGMGRKELVDAFGL